MQQPRISVFIVCLNEEANIRRCLESVRWCDEIIIVDSGSKDKTLEISKEFGARIFERPWPGFVAQKRFGLEQCTGKWVLNLDCDEEVSPELREEIKQILTNDPGEINGYEVNRVVFYLGKWWRRGGWYPEYRLRLLRRSAASWGGTDPHEKAIVSGRTTKLHGELRHYTYREISDQIRALNSFSSVAAGSLLDRGRTVSFSNLFLRPMGRFLKFFVLKRGFLEGFPGFIVAILESYYVFLKYAKLWELQRGAEKKISK